MISKAAMCRPLCFYCFIYLYVCVCINTPMVCVCIYVYICMYIYMVYVCVYMCISVVAQWPIFTHRYVCIPLRGLFWGT